MAGERARFSSFEADLETGELFQNGVKLPLQEKPFQILALLLQSPGELITREEIASKVWPGVFVENDLCLNTAVRRLRAVLEKAVPATDLIETVGSRGYRLRAQVNIQPAHASQSRNHEGLRLAVLPFVNLNEDPRDHSCEGLTAQMIVQLGRAYKSLSVISPVTSFYFTGKTKSLAQITQRLRADYVLQGTVWRLSPQLRISARLTRCADQCCVWSDSFVRQDRDIFQVQDEIARSISHELMQALPEVPSLPACLMSKPAVYDKYLKARFFSYKFVQSSFEKATKLFEQVIEEDPNFAPAYAALAQMLTAAVTYGGPPHQLFYDRIEDLAHRALQMSEDLGEAHCALGWTKLWRMDPTEGERSFRRAIEINPSLPVPHIGLGHLLTAVHRHDEAIAAGKRACELDPLSPVPHSMLGLHLYAAGKLDEATACEEEALEIDPGFCPAHAMLGFINHEMGEMDRAVLSLQRAVQHGPDTPLMKCFLARELASAGRAEEARQILNEILDLRKTNCIPATTVAFIYHALGEHEQAWEWLETAIRELDPWQFGIAVDPRYRCFWNNDDRFLNLLRRYDFPMVIIEPFVSRACFAR
ncbi:MAG TPA: winged helix-turn-helix domain-containing protein [Verrucomicrobiae bacterium]|jgi:TolB-like protein/Tfp pilus assembly protein PilF|nr:winged helix-turn-helix domain-containing protein [Verrucomicrobiae bacterium]